MVLFLLEHPVPRVSGPKGFGVQNFGPDPKQAHKKPAELQKCIFKGRTLIRNTSEDSQNQPEIEPKIIRPRPTTPTLAAT